MTWNEIFQLIFFRINFCIIEILKGQCSAKTQFTILTILAYTLNVSSLRVHVVCKYKEKWPEIVPQEDTKKTKCKKWHWSSHLLTLSLSQFHINNLISTSSLYLCPSCCIQLPHFADFSLLSFYLVFIKLRKKFFFAKNF